MVIEVKQNGRFVKIPYITADAPVQEAPLDGKQYVRQDAAWSEIVVPDIDLSSVETKIAANTSAIEMNTIDIAANSISISTNTKDLDTIKTTVSGLSADVSNINNSIHDIELELPKKVNSVIGKGLSTNDYTTEDKTKLASIAEGAEVNVNADWNAIEGDAQILNKPALSVVATSGNYEDLSNTPEVVNVATSGSYEDLLGQNIVATVDIHKEYVDSKVATKADNSTTYTKSEVDAKVSSVYRVRGSVATVDDLPTTGIVVGDVYNITSTGANYVAIEVTESITWDKLSETVDLTPYATKSEMNTAISTAVNPKLDATTAATLYVAKIEGKGLSTNDYTTAEKTEVAKISNKVDKVTGKQLSSNDYTATDKAEVAKITNKVDKVSGKALSTNDYTTAEKTKLSSLIVQAVLTQDQYNALGNIVNTDNKLYFIKE